MGQGSTQLICAVPSVGSRSKREVTASPSAVPDFHQSPLLAAVSVAIEVTAEVGGDLANWRQGRPLRQFPGGNKGLDPHPQPADKAADYLARHGDVHIVCCTYTLDNMPLSEISYAFGAYY